MVWGQQIVAAGAVRMVLGQMVPQGAVISSRRGQAHRVSGQVCAEGMEGVSTIHHSPWAATEEEPAVMYTSQSI
eukprot:1214398-Rhodomonas_salina.1